MPYVRRIGGTMTAPTEVKIGTEVKKYVRDIISRGDCPLFFPSCRMKDGVYGLFLGIPYESAGIQQQHIDRSIFL